MHHSQATGSLLGCWALANCTSFPHFSSALTITLVLLICSKFIMKGAISQIFGEKIISNILHRTEKMQVAYFVHIK